jgi:hypothetical protein
MNEKLINDITDFMNDVGQYIDWEYPAYSDSFKNNDCFDLVGSYYMGGSNPQDTARYMVQYFKMIKND